MANTKFQVKRTTVSGRQPNTLDPSNTSYIAPGEFALNLADGKLYTSNGALITVGSNQDTVTADQGNFNNISLDGGISIGTATDNASINSTSLFAGNGSVNVVVNTSILTVSNSTANSTVSPVKIFVGNSTANAQFSLGAGAVSLTIDKYAYNSTTGLATFTTTANTGLIEPLRGSYVTITGLPTAVSTFNGTNELYGAPTANTFTIKKTIGGKIVSASRTNGVATVTTEQNHGFATNDVTTVSGIGTDAAYSGFTFNGTQTITGVPTSKSFTYANQPRITVSPTSYYIDTTQSLAPVFITSSNHGFETGMPLSTTVNLSGTITSNVKGFMLNVHGQFGSSGDTPTVYIQLDTGSNASNFAENMRVSLLTPSGQYVNGTASSTSAGPRVAKISKISSTGTTTTSTTHRVETDEPHGLIAGTYVYITGLSGATGSGTSTSSIISNFNDKYIEVGTISSANSFNLVGATATKNSSINGGTNANVAIRVPNNLGFTSTGTVKIVADNLIRLDGASSTNVPTAAASRTFNTTSWWTTKFPKQRYDLKGKSWSRANSTTNVVRILHNYNRNIFQVGDYIAIFCQSQNILSGFDNRNAFRNTLNTNNEPFNWSAITAVDTTNYNWFEITVDASKFGSTLSSGFTSSADNTDWFVRPYATSTTSNQSNTTYTFTRNYSAKSVTKISNTSFRLPVDSTVDTLTSNLGSSSAPFSLSTGTITANTDRTVSQVSITGGAIAGVSSISETATSASATTFIAPFTEVANTSSAVKVTSSTFYTGNTTANVFVNSSIFEISTTDSKQISNSSVLQLSSLTGGVIDTSKPSLFMNSTTIQIGPNNAGKYYRAGVDPLTGTIYTTITGSEFTVGTEIDNTSIVDSTITLSSDNGTNYLAANLVQLTSNVEINGPLAVAGSYGLAGQLLYTDGANPYWADAPQLDTTLDYTFTGGVNFAAPVQSSSQIVLDDGSLNYSFITTSGLDVSANTNETVSLYGNSITFTSNSANLDVSTSIYANSSVIKIGNSSVNVAVNSTVFTGTANNATYAYGKTESALNVNNALTSNNSTYAFGKSESALNVNSALTSNNSTYAFGKSESDLNVNSALTSNNSTYAFGKSESGLNVNSALTSNNSTYAFGKTEGNLNVNSALTSNNSTYAFGKSESALNVNSALTANNSNNLGGVAASGYQTTAGLASNVATLAANSATYLGSSINSGNSTGIYSTGVMTASGIVSGSELTSTLASGDEGGQINLAKPPNGTAAGGITIDAYQNKIRIFEQGGNARGAYIDITACANGVGTNLLTGGSGGTGTVTSVGSANGIAGGPITGSGTLYAVAGNTTLFVNASGIHVNTSALPSVNLNSQYTWTNTQTFQANISFTGNNISLVTNTGSIFFAGSSDANWRIGRNTGATTKFYYTNNSLDIIAANSNLEGIVFGWTGDSYLETGYAGTFTKNPIYVGNSAVNVSINSTSFSGTANNATYAFGKTEGALNVNSALTSNNSTYAFGKLESDLNVNNALTANTSTYLGGSANFGNSSGIYSTGVVNAAALSVGTSFISNVTQVTVAVPLSANGGTGSSGQVLTSNGATGAPYWSTIASGGVNTDAQYTWSNTQTFSNTVFLNAVSANGSLGSAGQLLTSNGTDTYWSTVTSAGAPRVNSATSTATLAWDSSSYDQYQLTAMAANTTVSADSATSPNNGQRIIFRFKDNGTARTISWTTGTTNSFRAVGVTLPNTTVISKTLYVGGIYNSADSRWDVIAVAQES